jgi:hypothetical protein
MPRNGRFLLFGLVAAPYALLAVSGNQAKPTYAADVLPVMKAHCASCHSGGSASANLDLTSVAGIKKALTPGSSSKSVLIERLRGTKGAQMPMGFAPLPKATIDKIAAWIDNGAVFESGPLKHWAYVKPVKPKVPFEEERLSTKKDKWVWFYNPIDSFILQRLRKEGQKPSPEAAKETLLRRVYLDLIGLPPSPQQLDAFLADKRPDAYERVVDSLLKNPHYGERQAEPWLDLSRYADSDGYEKDLNRTIWKYRDWLIDAFNRNLSYDKFTIELLAGDLLPNPTLDQLVATGFNRNTMFNREGGVDQEDAHYNVVLDRVNTTSTVWLGSTLQCSRCHDHKYDPFTQRDYYRMAAFFANSVIKPEGSNQIGEEKWFESEIKVPTPKQEAEQRKLKSQITELNRRMAVMTPELTAVYNQWLKEVAHGPAWTVLNPTSVTALNGTTFITDEFGVVTAGGPVPATDDYTVIGKAGLSRLTGISIETIASKSLPSGGPGRADNGNFVISTLKLTVSGRAATLSRAVADFDQRENGADKVNGKDANFGWAVYGATGKSHEIVFDLGEPLDVKPDDVVQVVIGQRWPGGKHTIGKFRVSLTDTQHPVSLTLPTKIRALLARATDEAESAALQAYFRSIAPQLDGDRAHLKQLTQTLTTLENSIPTTLVMRDKPTTGPLTAYIHNRGEFLNPTELVTTGYPVVLAPKPVANSEATITKTSQLRVAPDAKGAVPHINDNGRPGLAGRRLNRLDLAKWLVSRDNPLTARVQVNRMWEQFFGRGLVETSEDFGTQGSRPSHPQLLDWLACEFMDKGWDMKAMVRLIVTSRTYRQQSNASPARIAKDPQNVLLTRGPRVRLDSETIRDNMLAASGLLSSKIGGPSVYPPQPAGVWDTPYNGERWMESKGEDRYRRGLYTFIKRSSPYPSFLSFDSTSRESCTVRRIRTNTPLQALALLNDQACIEAARALGARMLREGGATVDSRLSYGFRLCTGRRPNAGELSRLKQLLANLTSKYLKDSEASKKIGSTPAEAAWTMVSNVLLNLDETVTKG